jgi:hypothetical protein
MSSDLGFAQVSPFTSLRRAPTALGVRHCRRSTVGQPIRLGSGWQGVMWSEVKEETAAQPSSGDMSGTERPATPSSYKEGNSERPVTRQ